MSFPRYPAYRDSGVHWIGEVPAHWTLSRIRAFTNFVGGGTPSREIPSYWGGEIPWVSPKDMKTECIESSEECITEAGLVESTASRVPAGRVLMVVRSGILKHTIPVAINAVPVALNQDMKALAFEPGICLSSFFLRWVQGFNNSLLLVWAKQGATVESIEHEYLANTVVPLPSMEEQRAIAAFLDRETAKIDALVAEQRRLMDLLREKRQAVISHAVTKGLNPNAPMKDSGVEWMGEVPAHWQVVQSRRLFKVRSERARLGDEQLTASQKYGIVRQSDFVEWEGRRVVEAILGKDNLLHVEPDDFVISMRSFQGGIERSTLRGSISFHYVMLVPNALVHPPFFAHLMKCAPYIQALQSTTDLIRDGQELRYSHFVKVDLPVVPFDEQVAIAVFLDSALQRIDSLMAEAERSLPLLLERRAALITAAVTGEIDVRSLALSEAA